MLIEDGSFQQIARIFLSHGAHLDYGIALLHRHHDLPPGHAMVHESEGPDTSICRIEPLGLREIFPSSHHLVEDDFLPYEFTYERVQPPPTDFLAELATFLMARGLSEIIAVTHLSSKTERWLESMTDNGTTSTRMLERDDDLWPAGHIPTEWHMRQDEGTIEIIASKFCHDEPAGHRRTGGDK